MTTTTTKTQFLAALAAGMLAVPMAASAAEVTQLIHFDDANNGWKWYSDKDLNFLFDPTNLQSSTQCADSTNGGNGNCVIESTNGVLPLMTRPTTGPSIQGHANQAPDVSGAEKFTLNAFYFLLTGQGGVADNLNAIFVKGNPNGGPEVTYEFRLEDTYGGPFGVAPLITFYEGPNAGTDAGALEKLTGYIVEFGDLFKDVTYIDFSATDSAQVRLDCVVATFEGSTTEPYSMYPQNCGTGGGGANGNGNGNGGGGGNGNGNGVPEPGTLALLGLGLLGAAAARRRRSV